MLSECSMLKAVMQQKYKYSMKTTTYPFITSKKVAGVVNVFNDVCKTVGFKASEASRQ